MTTFAYHVRCLARLSGVRLIPFVDSMGNEVEVAPLLSLETGKVEVVFKLGLGDNVAEVRLDPNRCESESVEVVAFAIHQLCEMDASRQADLAELERLHALPQ